MGSWKCEKNPHFFLRLPYVELSWSVGSLMSAGAAGEDVVAHPTICREAISFYIVLVGKNCGMDGLN